MIEPFRQANQWLSQKINPVPGLPPQPDNSPAPPQTHSAQFANQQAWPPFEPIEAKGDESASPRPLQAAQQFWKRLKASFPAHHPASQAVQGLSFPRLPVHNAPHAFNSAIQFEQPLAMHRVSGQPDNLTPGGMARRLAEKLHLKPKPQAQPKQPRLRSREEVLKGFPNNDLKKIPHYTLSPEEIAENVLAPQQEAFEEALVADPWDPEDWIDPFEREH